MNPLGQMLFAVALAAPVATSTAQSGGYVATLGSDTLHVESFTRTADRISGTIVTRSPLTRVARYELRFENGKPSRYELRTARGDGSPDPGTGANANLLLTGDSLTREITAADGQVSMQRIHAPSLTLPGPSLPYVGVSYLMYELAFADARTRQQTAGESTVRFITMNPRQVQSSPTRVWFIGADSVEMDYFGVARSGYKLDASGGLVRADWTGTTYRYRITRVSQVDVERIAAEWSAKDRAGTSMGALSPRDTSRASLGATTISVEYSRPSRRGRTIWGDVVPWGRVWRLGADVATHVQFSGDVRIGDADVAAGRYTLWMLPVESGESQLIVSKAVNVFGTQYNPANDLVRIPLRRDNEPSASRQERLTIDVSDGRLRVRWSDISWSVPIQSR
jgi:hypothetical protein